MNTVNALPAFYFPTTLVCVDDSRLTLSGYAKTFAGIFRCVLYEDPTEVQQFFNSYESQLSKINFLNKATEFENDSRYTVQSLVQLDISKIIDLADCKSRYDEVAVLLADYHMLPEMNGLELCKSLKDRTVKKVLITERQTYETATQALNKELIDYFIHKSESLEEFRDAVRDVAIRFFCKLSEPFKVSLEVNGLSPMSDKKFIRYFTTKFNEKKITEYYLLDKNGSYLLIDKDGKRYILIVHTDQSLSELVNILEEYDDLLHDVVESIKKRELIPFLGIHKDILDIELSDMEKYLYKAEIIRGDQPYYVHLLEC